MNKTLGIPVAYENIIQLPSKGPSTIHQRALLWFWLTSLTLLATRCFTKYFRLENGNNQLKPFAAMETGVVLNNDEQKEIVHDTTPNHTKPVIIPNKSKSNSTSNEPSFDKFLKRIAILGCIMLYFYICDYERWFPAASRVYSRDVFVFLCLVLLLVGVCFTTRDCQDKILAREQTEEWKGLMQVMFIWYHYFKAAEIYNAIRIFIAAYVWMTGFGNFSFFWIRKDFSLYRVMKMMFRLNFLVVITCLVTANEYMLYYICAMHTFWFMSVYALMRPLYSKNTQAQVMAVKLVLYAGIVFVLFDVPNVGKLMFKPFRLLLNYKNSLHEWVFRSGLDHFATLLGIICAYFHPNFETLLSHMERKDTSKKYKIIILLAKIATAFGCLAAVVVWWKYIFILQKYEYNALHPYFSFVPLLGYICLRNLFPFFRTRFIYLFSWLGKITLETYISQLHIYMQGNAKYLIVYVPGYPLLNFALATVIYLFLSYSLFNVTVDLSAYLIPKDMKVMGKHIVIGVLWFTGCYIIAGLFKDAKALRSIL